MIKLLESGRLWKFLKKMVGNWDFSMSVQQNKMDRFGWFLKGLEKVGCNGEANSTF